MKKYFRWYFWLLLATVTFVALIPALPYFHPSSPTTAYAEGASPRLTQASRPTPPPLTVFRGRPLPTGHMGNELPRGWKPPIPTRFQSSSLIQKSGVGHDCSSPCSPPLVLYNAPNSSVLNHPHVMMIFWGPEWGDSTNNHYPTYVEIMNTEELLFKNLAGSHYNNLLTQYYGSGGQVVNDKNDPVFQGATLDQTAPPSGIDNNAEASEIVSAINANPNWASVPDGVFMLFPQEGSTYNDPILSKGCGYHSVSNDGNNHLYSMEPYLNDLPFLTGCIVFNPYGSNIVDAMTVVASHEYAEAVTDPWSNLTNTQAWLDTQQNNEIGDLCAPEHVLSSELGGVMVQNLFDNFAYAHNHSQGCDTSSGPLLWRYQTGNGVNSSPAVVNGVVYVGSGDNYIYALNANDGSLLWDYKTGNAVRSSPRVVNGVVYIGSDDNSLYALNASNGSLIWSYNTTLTPIDDKPAVANGVVYFGSSNGYLYALNANNGLLLWSYQTGGPIDSSSPVVANGVVYVGSGDNNVYALKAKNGTPLWHYQTGGSVYSSPTVVNGVVYVGSGDNYIYALNASAGSLLWRYQTGGLVFSSPTVINGIVYFGSGDDHVYALNANSGSFVWSYQTGGSIVYSSAAVVNGVVYIGSVDDYIYALNASAGSLLWRYHTSNLVTSSPTVANGVVYVGSSDNYVYAFKTF